MSATNQIVWDEHYGRMRAIQQYPDENIVRIVKKQYSQKQPNSFALDLGSGSGRHLPLLADHFDHVAACDFSREALKNYGGIQAALPELPFAEAAFDFILCWGVLHYVSSAQIPTAIAAIGKALKPGGTLFLTLRSDKDTHLKAQLATGDLKKGHADLYSKEAALKLFASFAALSYGFISRQPLGEDQLVAHHMISVTR